MTPVLVAALALGAVLVPLRAAADERAATAPLTSAAKLDDLDTLLGHFASQTRGYRTWAGAAALTIGAVSLPAGIVMTTANHGSFAGPLVIGLGAGDLVGGALLLAFPSGPNAQFQQLADLERRARDRGASPDEVVRTVEGEWQKAALRSRAVRQTVGVVSAGLGVLSVTAGAILSFADFSSAQVTREDQFALGSGLLGLGNAGVLFGLQAFFFEEPIETAWATYASLTHAAKVPDAAWFHPRLRGVSLRPAPGGGVAAVTATY